MTVIVGLKDDKGQVWMGADCQTTQGDTILFDKTNKLLDFGAFVIGTTGYAAFKTVLKDFFSQNSTDWKMGSKEEVLQFLKDFYKFLKHEYNYGSSENNELPSFYNSFLICTKNSIYEISSNFGISQIHDEVAMGCGMDFTLGSLWSTKSLPPKKRVEIAIEAANRYSTGCTGVKVIKVK